MKYSASQKGYKIITGGWNPAARVEADTMEELKEKVLETGRLGEWRVEQHSPVAQDLPPIVVDWQGNGERHVAP